MSDTGNPEYLPPSWTYLLGGPVPTYDEPYEQDQDDEPPALQPVAESETMRRLRAQLRDTGHGRNWHF